jgi:hypothetical protein
MLMMRTPLPSLCYRGISFTYANRNESLYLLAGLGSRTLGIYFIDTSHGHGALSCTKLVLLLEISLPMQRQACFFLCLQAQEKLRHGQQAASMTAGMVLLPTLLAKSVPQAA